MSLNLAFILRESAAAKPDKPALILDGFRMIYRELDEATDAVALNLRSAGLERGQSVGLMLPNLPEFVIAYYGLLKAGAVVVPMNPLLKAPEVAHYLDDSDATALIAWGGSAAEALEGASRVGPPGTEPAVDSVQSFRKLWNPVPAQTWSPPTRTTPPSSSTPPAPPGSPRGRSSRTSTSS